MKGRLEIGQKLLKLERSAPVFFQNWGDGSSFEGCRDSSSGERGVDDGRNEGDQRREGGFNKFCGDGGSVDKWMAFYLRMISVISERVGSWKEENECVGEGKLVEMLR